MVCFLFELVPPVFLATATVGYVLFGVFVAAFLTLAVITLRWAVRRDRSGRAEWVRRQQEIKGATGGPGSVPGAQRRAARRRR